MKIPKDWTFENEDVAKCFDSHVREQLPWYDLATEIVSHVARHYIPQKGLVYDIGASTGNIGLAIKKTISNRNANLISIDSSKEMLKAYKGINPLIIDNAVTFEYDPFDFAICFLVLMFIHPSERINLIKKLKSKVKYGGAIIIFDKCEPLEGYIATVISRLSLSSKLNAGVEEKEIIEKELSLSGVQRPIRVSDLGDAKEIFRFGDFAGWIIEG